MDDGDLESGDGGGAGPDPLRGRFEKAISMASPLLDLVLAVGDRISRIAEPVDYEYYPVRSDTDTDSRGSSGGGEADRDR